MVAIRECKGDRRKVKAILENGEAHRMSRKI
jgi:hypothetical protein